MITRPMLRQFRLFYAVLGDLLGLTGIGAGLGYLGWKYLGVPSWGMLITSGIGMTYGFYRIYKRSEKELD